MIHFKKYSSSCSLFLMMDDHFSTSSDVRGGVVFKTYHFSPKNIGLVGDRHDVEFSPYQRHFSAHPMALVLSRYYPVGDYYGYFFGVTVGGVKGGVGPRATHLTSQKFDFCIDGGNFMFSWGSDYSSMSHCKKYRSSYSLSQKNQ